MDDDALILLDDVCKRYFNIDSGNARRKAAINALPVPAFRLTTSGKGPFYITKKSLTDFLEARIAKATATHRVAALS